MHVNVMTEQLLARAWFIVFDLRLNSYKSAALVIGKSKKNKDMNANIVMQTLHVIPQQNEFKIYTKIEVRVIHSSPKWL